MATEKQARFIANLEDQLADKFIDTERAYQAALVLSPEKTQRKIDWLLEELREKRKNEARKERL